MCKIKLKSKNLNKYCKTQLMDPSVHKTFNEEYVNITNAHKEKMGIILNNYLNKQITYENFFKMCVNIEEEHNKEIRFILNKHFCSNC
jgi:hypothetical protein